MLLNLVQQHLDFIVFILALLAERFLPLVSWYHPNIFLTAVFRALGKRVFRKSEPASYQYLSSSLCFTLVILVIMTLVVLLLEFAYYPELLAGLILYLCLEWRSVESKALRIARLVKQNQKSTARELLKPLLARQVDKLSGPGLCKAIMETLILRVARHYFSVIFFYLLFGPMAALAYRLLTLIHQAWRKDIMPNSPFLKSLSWLLYILEWLPTRILALTIAASKASKLSIHYIKHYGRHFYQINSGWLLSCCSASVGVQLGGPAIYQDTRFDKMRIGTERLPQADDITVLINRLNQARGFWLLVIFGIEIIKTML
ncbi:MULTISPECIES: cobalamin biosynthesis protein [Pseudoalteromonas]|uniref:Cobalamin biosynthesis protein n=1 Tax=Pseudoalteromonas neustonica TaxID=1840331 RepID=A0ABY3FEY6_9GAMM|nr:MULTISPECIES: cobalamin biosynthesis protein [Pseudoalteromonas]MBB1310030.1 cobalamin biosynthesis protein [Pseudoalteromonas sp. SR41-8]MBB1396890.1 cobalamin biosynthesis protein [Pseudoalteromonas sp. SG44-8]MBB1409652.1 cobalamin biosynthesis protein [Pseudoalteromonas sp. SG44-17]TVU83551.1 cobalamin biosynthesis protein [Pseudoalteromonas neustonica]